MEVTHLQPPAIRLYGPVSETLRRRITRVLIGLILSGFCLVYGFFFALMAPYLIVWFVIPILILLALAIWALPNVISAPARSMEVLFFAFFMALIMWPNYLAISLPGLPWITMIRLTGFPMAFCLLICVSVSQRFREETADAFKSMPVGFKAFCAFLAIQFLSIAFSSNISNSFNKLIVFQVAWTSVFFVACHVFLKKGRVQRWAMIMWLMCVLVGVIGLYEHRLSAIPWAGHVPSFLKIEDEAVIRILSGQARAATGIHRVQSTFTTSLGLAEFIALGMPFVLFFLGKQHSFVVRALAGVSVPYLFYILLISQSRLGIIGFFLAVLLNILVWSVRTWKLNKNSLFAPALTFSYPLIFCGFIAATFLIGRLRTIVWGNGSHQYSNESRLTQYQEGFAKLLTHPHGYGIGQGAEALGVTNPAGVLTIDTYYVMIALEYGALGAIAYFTFIVGGIVYGAKNIQNITRLDLETEYIIPITISLINFFVIKSIFSNQDNHPVVFMMLGMLAALIHRAQQASSAEVAGLFRSPKI